MVTGKHKRFPGKACCRALAGETQILLIDEFCGVCAISRIGFQQVEVSSPERLRGKLAPALLLRGMVYRFDKLGTNYNQGAMLAI